MAPSNQRQLLAVAPQGNITKPVVDFLWHLLYRDEEYFDSGQGAMGLQQMLGNMPQNGLRTICSDGIAWEVAMHIRIDEDGKCELNSNNLQADRLVQVLVEFLQMRSRRQQQETKSALMLGVLEAHNKIISIPDPPPRHRLRRVQLHLNCHAFASRLFYNEVLTDDMLLVQAMREAFEVTNPEANIHLTLVAVWSWLARCHNELVRRITTKETTQRGSSARYEVGELYYAQGGRPRLDERRWNFWKARFLTLTDGHYEQTHQLRGCAENMHQFGAGSAPVTSS
ncbi:hypothetical protein SLS62_003090 [Diatrype stigma]|uniref:Uncharacterized protein n=1 Tax=Diatrype stigma TaxID=117547 RepID=A0AAN9UW35_9PEZI